MAVCMCTDTANHVKLLMLSSMMSLDQAVVMVPFLTSNRQSSHSPCTVESCSDVTATLLLVQPHAMIPAAIFNMMHGIYALPKYSCMRLLCISSQAANLALDSTADLMSTPFNNCCTQVPSTCLLSNMLQ